MGKFTYAQHFPDSRLAYRFDGAAASNPLIGDLIERHLEMMQDRLAPSTIISRRYQLNFHLIPTFGNRRIKDLTMQEVWRWIQDLRRTLNTQTIQSILTPLRSVYENAVMENILERNPMDSIKLRATKTYQPDPLSRTEIIKVLNKLTPEWRNYFILAFWTGMRTSELIGLHWSDINLEKQILVVRRAVVYGITKGPKSDAGRRTINLLEPVIKALGRQQRITGHQESVFRNPINNNALYKGMVYRVWKKALADAGVRHRRSYATRETFASLMLSVGENPMWVAQQMGHKDWGLLRTTYAAWLPDVAPEAGQTAKRFAMQFPN